jgi:hypothetical protein
VSGGRLIVADPGLNGPAGHHLSYSAAVAGAAREAGMGAVVLAGRGFQGRLPGGIETHAVLGTAYQTAGGGGGLRRALYGGLSRLPAPVASGLAGVLRAARRRLQGAAPDRLAEELAAALAPIGAGPGDHLLLHSVSGANLASIAAGPDLGGAVLLVVLRRMPAEMEADDPAPEPLAALLRQLHARFGQRLRLFADTEMLAEDFARLSGLPVRPVPLPIQVPPRVPRVPDALPHCVFAGGARLEKGYHTLPAAIAAHAGRARFTIQSGPVGSEADPLVQRAHRALQAMAGDGVTLVERALEPDDYAAMLAGADLLLLPYHGPTYGARSSGILAEALAMGVPAVVPADCWMQAAAGPDRAVAVPDGQALAPALAEALDRLPALSAAAVASAPAWRSKHSPAALLAALLASA